MCICGRKEGDIHCESSITDMVWGIYVRDTDLSVYVEGRREGKEGDNPCKIRLTDTDFCIYISP